MSSFSGLESLKSMYFCIFFFLYVFIVAENVALIGLILLHKSLHEPMYLLVCNLSANGIYGSTALMPLLLKQILSQSYEISVAGCRLQVFAIHTYAIVEFSILAAMSYDRYVAICRPLHYHATLPLSKVWKIIAGTWLLPFVAFLAMFSLTLKLRFCNPILDRLYCLNYSLVKLSCTNTAFVNIAGIVTVFLFSMPQFLMIIYTYGHIMKICVFASKECRSKALRTCVPHLLALVNYSVGCFFEIAQSRSELSHLTFEGRTFMSLYFLIFTPILNPAIYGASIQRIRAPLLRMFHRGKGKITPTL